MNRCKRISRLTLWALACCGLTPAASYAAQADDRPAAVAPLPVGVQIDLHQPIGPWKPIHRFYGADEPNYAYMPAGKRLLSELGKTSPQTLVYFRTHFLFCTGDGTPDLKWGSTNVYTEKPDGTPVYDFTLIDRIFDTYLQAGVRPYFELGFMPKALSTHPEPYHTPFNQGDPKTTTGGWSYPPKDYAKWSELCYQVVHHCVERFGKSEVEKWYFETWNEPNIHYFTGSPEEFLKVHDYAVAGVRRALPNARVGGPDTAGDGGPLMQTFLDHCFGGTNFATGERGTPTDFVSFHAKGAPKSVDGHVRMGLAAQLQTMDRAFRAFGARPQTRSLPIVIGECDPEGCAACRGPSNAYRNGTMYSSFTVESFARAAELAAARGVNLEGALTWAFEFEGQPPFAGFRVLASGDIDHAVLNVFRFLGKMEGQRVKTVSDGALPLEDVLQSGVRTKPDVGAIATMAATAPGKPRQVCVLLWHYHDDDVPGPAALVTLDVSAFGPDAGRLDEYRIDAEHGNAFPRWLAMGSPQTPTPDQMTELKEAAAKVLVRQSVEVRPSNEKAKIQLELPRQAVALIVLHLNPPSDTASGQPDH